MEAMEKFIRECIAYFRKEYELLSPEERSHITNLEDFNSPCQIVAYRFRNSDLGTEVHLWIVTHFEQFPDYDVTVYGPIESFKATEELASIITSPRFDYPFPRSVDFGYQVDTYRPLLEGAILQAIDQLRHNVNQVVWAGEQPITKGHQRTWLGKNAFHWMFNADPKKQDPDTLIGEIIGSAKRQAKVIRTTPKERAPRPESPKLKGYGTYIYPHVWVGAQPEKTFQERLNDRMYGKSLYAPAFPNRSAPVLTNNLDGSPIAVYNDGFVAYVCQDKSDALQILNVMMAVLTLLGLPLDTDPG